MDRAMDRDTGGKADRYRDTKADRGWDTDGQGYKDMDMEAIRTLICATLTNNVQKQRA
jgi:hypothetical protein